MTRMLFLQGLAKGGIVASFWRPSRRTSPGERTALRPLQSLPSGLSFSLTKPNTGVLGNTNALAGTDPRGHAPSLRNTRPSSRLPAPRRSPRLQRLTLARSPGLPAPIPFLHSPSPGGNTPQTPNNEDLCDADGGWGQFTTSETLARVWYRTA